MGYTHYWRMKRAFSEEEWKKFTDGVNKILAKTKVSICGGMGTGEPIISEEYVSLNGDESKGEDYESFVVTKEPQDFEFCKTARRPYDEVVCACLLLMEDILGNSVKVSSDGDRELDWVDGINLHHRVFGKKR